MLKLRPKFKNPFFMESLKELNKQLRRGGTVELDASLQVGAAGEIVLESTNKVALRKGAAARSEGGTRLLQGFDIDESEGAKPIHEQAWRERGGSVAVAAMG